MFIIVLGQHVLILIESSYIIIKTCCPKHNKVLLCLTDTSLYIYMWGTAVAQWLRRCATNRKVAGSIPDGVIGIFH